MTKRKILGCLIILVLISAAVIMTGCGQEDKPAPGVNGQQAPAGSSQPIELNFATWQPPQYPNNTLVFEPFIQEVEQKTEGRVKMYLQPGSVLVGGGETFDAVATGMVDMGFSLPAYTPGRFPLTTILEFPFMFSSSLQANQAAAELYKNNAAFQKEYDEVKVIYVGATDTAALVSAKPVETLEDFKGLRVRTPGPVQNDMINAFGGTPVSMPYPEVYDAMQRGVVDATFGPQTAIYPFNLHEVSSHIVLVDFYATPLYVVMNKASWNKISPADQAVIEELIEQIPLNIGGLYDERIIGFREQIEKEGAEGNITIITFSADDMQKARSILEPLEEKWLSQMEGQGLPARAVYDEVNALAEKYRP